MNDSNHNTPDYDAAHDAMHDAAYDTDALLTAYALGELQGDELARVEQLLAANPALLAEVEDIRRMASQLQQTLASEESTPAAAALNEQQRSAIHAKAASAASPSTAEQPYKFNRQWLYWGGGSALAAMLLVAVMLPTLSPTGRKVNHLPDTALNHPARPTESKDRSSHITLHEENARQSATGSTRTNLSQTPALTITDREEAPVSSRNDTLKSLGESAATPTRHAQAGQATPSTAKRENELNQIAASIPVPTAAPAPMSQPISETEPATRIHRLGVRGRLGDDGVVDARKVKPAVALDGITAGTADADLPGRFNPNFHTEGYDRITDNPYLNVSQNPLSTFSIDVDTASYANVRRMLSYGRLPPAGAVRIEEMINYFPYNYQAPATHDEKPFAVHVETASAPWAHEHRLVKIGLKGKDIPHENRPATNLVFLIDVSGSMLMPQKLPLLKQGMKLLVDQMTEKDRVSIVVYAGAAGLVLDATPGGSDEQRKIIHEAIDKLQGGGSTNGGAGIRLAYDLAQKHFIKEGVNRVILASDGDFNVGTTSRDELITMIEDKRKTGVFLTVLGFGMGNYKDGTMEQLANKGNGNYAYIDTLNEAKKVLVEQFSGTLFTIAKDVKIQVEFNPAKVQSYRLIGYENRLLAKEDFNDDTKDAGEIGAGHTVTALYEIVPVGVKNPAIPPVDDLKYQSTQPATPAVTRVTSEEQLPAGKLPSDELLTVKLRYKQPDGDVSTRMDVPVTDSGKAWQDASEDFRFVAAVAQYGMLLRNSPYKGSATYASTLDLAQSGQGSDKAGYRAEFIQLVQKTRQLTSPTPQQ